MEGHDGLPGAELVSRRLALSPLTPDFYDFVYRLHVDPAVGGRVKWSGATPSPDEVMRRMYDSVLAQFVVLNKRDGEPLGITVLSSADLANGYCFFSVMMARTVLGTGIGMEATASTLAYAFSTWDLRKIYAEAAQPNLDQFRGGLGKYFSEEGRLREHKYFRGAFHDLVTLAIYRDQWAQLGGLLSRLGVTHSGKSLSIQR